MRQIALSTSQSNTVSNASEKRARQPSVKSCFCHLVLPRQKAGTLLTKLQKIQSSHTKELRPEF